MPEVVGTAFVRLRIISTQVASDLKDAIDRGTIAANPNAEKGGQSLGDKMGKGLTDRVKPTVSKVSDDLVKGLGGRGEESGRKFMDSFGIGVKRDTSLRDASENIGKDAGARLAHGFSIEASKGVFSGRSSIDNAMVKAVTPSGSTLGSIKRSASNLGSIFSLNFGSTVSKLMPGHAKTGASSFSKAFFQAIGPDFNKNIDSVFGPKSPFHKALTSLSKIKFTGITTLITIALPLIIGAAKTIAFYIVGLVAQFGQLAVSAVGAGVALSGAFVGAIPALGVLAAALKTKTPELTAFQTEAKKIGETWKEVASATQQTLLPSLLSAFQVLSVRLVPILKDFGRDIGTTTGNMAKLTAEVLTNSKSMSSWSTLLDNARKIWANLLDSFGSIASVLAPLGASLSKIGTQFTGTVKGFADSWADMIQQMSTTGALDRLFQKWYDRAKVTFGGIWDLIVAIWNVLKAGADAAKPSFDAFASFADRFREWTGSLEGQNKLKDFFTTALGVMHEVNLVVRDIFKMLFTPLLENDTSNIVGGLTAFREEILPPLADLVKEITDNISGDVLKNFVISLTDLFTALQSAGFLSVGLRIMTLTLGILTAVLKTPGIGPAFAVFLGGLWGLATVAKPLVVVGPVLTKVAKGIHAVVLALMGKEAAEAGPILKALGHAMETFWISLSIGAGGQSTAGLTNLQTFVATIGQLTLGAGAGVFWGLAAAIGAFYVVSYFAFRSARKVVDQLWESIQNLKDQFGSLFSGEGDPTSRIKSFYVEMVKLSVALFTFPGRVFIADMEDVGASIRDNILPAIGDGIAAVGRFAGEIGGKIGDFASKIPGWLAGAAEALVGWITNAVPQIPGKLAEFGTAVATAIATFISNIPGWLAGAASAMVDWINKAATDLPGKIGFFIGFLIGSIVKIPVMLAIAMAQAGVALWGWIVDAVPAALEAMGGWWEAVENAVRTFIGNIPGWFVTASVFLFSWIVEAVPAALVAIGNFFNNLGTSIADFIRGIPGMVTEGGPALWNWIVDAIPKALSAANEFFDNIRTAISDFITSLPEKLGAAIDVVEDVGKSIVEGIWNGITGQASWLIDQVKGFIGGVIDGFKEAIGFGSPATKFIEIGVSILQGVVQGIAGLPGAVIGAVGDAATWLADTGAKVLTGFRDGLTGAWDTVVKGAINIGQWIMDMVSDASSWLVDTGGKILTGLKDGMIAIWTGEIKAAIAIGSWILELVTGAGEWLYNIGGDIIRGLGNGIKTIWDTEVRGLLIIGQWTLDLVTGAADWLVDTGGNIIRGLYNGIKNLWDREIRGLLKIADWIKGLVTGAIDWLKGTGGDIIKGLYNGIKDFWNTWIVGWVVGIPGRILGLIGDMGRLLFNAGKAIIDGLLNGIKAAWEGVTNFVGGIGGWIADHKGPLDKDRKLLVPAGLAIMQGLQKGLDQGFKGVADSIDGMINQLTEAQHAQMSIIVDANLVAGAITSTGLSRSIALATSNQVAVNSGSNNTASLAASLATLRMAAPQVDVEVKIGETPINDLVDTRIKVKDDATARTLTARGLG